MATATTTTYKPYDYSKLTTAASQPGKEYKPYDYSQSLKLAEQARTSTGIPISTVSYGDVKGQIQKAGETLSTPTMQNAGLVSQLTGDILSNLDPVRRTQEARINEQYNASRRGIEEALAAKGLLRSGQYGSELTRNEQNRNQALAEANASLIQGALAQALPFGQLALSEKGMLQGQQSTAANQLASLLGQQTGAQQWGTAFNAEQAQNQFANIMAAQQAQAGEGQFGAQFANQQQQQQFQNLMNALQLAAGENRFGQQFDVDTALQQAALTGQYQGTPTMTQQQFVEQQRQANLDEAYRQAVLGQQGQQFDWNKLLQQAELTGQFQGQQTLPAQLQAANLANQTYNQNLATYQALLNTILGIAQQSGQLNWPTAAKPGDALTTYLNLLSQRTA